MTPPNQEQSTLVAGNGRLVAIPYRGYFVNIPCRVLNIPSGNKHQRMMRNVSKSYRTGIMSENPLYVRSFQHDLYRNLENLRVIQGYCRKETVNV